MAKLPSQHSSVKRNILLLRYLKPSSQVYTELAYIHGHLFAVSLLLNWYVSSYSGITSCNYCRFMLGFALW